MGEGVVLSRSGGRGGVARRLGGGCGGSRASGGPTTRTRRCESERRRGGGRGVGGAKSTRQVTGKKNLRKISHVRTTHPDDRATRRQFRSGTLLVRDDARVCFRRALVVAPSCARGARWRARGRESRSAAHVSVLPPWVTALCCVRRAFARVGKPRDADEIARQRDAREATRGARPGVSSACCRAPPPGEEEEDERGARADASGRARRPDDDARVRVRIRGRGGDDRSDDERRAARGRRGEPKRARRGGRDERNEGGRGRVVAPPPNPRAIELEVGFEEPDLPAFEPPPRVPGSPSASGRINREDSRRIRTLDAMKRDARAALRRHESDERRAEES